MGIKKILYTFKKNFSMQITKKKIKQIDKAPIEEVEPKYIKLYLDDLCLLKSISSNQNNILIEILKLVNFEKNEIVLNRYYRDEISKTLNTSDQTIRNCISSFKKKQILISIGTGVYKLNPYLFGTSSWQNVKGFRLTIEYTANGRKENLKEIFK